MTIAQVAGATIGRMPSAPALSLKARMSLKAWTLLAPSLVFLVLFTYWPVLRALWTSLHAKPLGTAGSTWVGLENYRRIFDDEAFRNAAWNNLVYALGTVPPSLALGLAFALALRRSSRFTSAVRAVLFFPSLVPLVAAAALFSFIFMPGIGLLDYYLAKLGAPSVRWIGDPDLALFSLVGLTVWKNAGYYMLFFLAGLAAIPEDAHEAALIEGANFWQRLWYVTLPYLRPTIAFVAVIASLNCLTLVDHVVVLTKGGPSQSTNLLLFYIFQNAHEFYETGKAAAATVVSVAGLLALSTAGLRALDRGDAS